MYILASCKEWHFPYFEALKRDVSADFLWVSRPEELLDVIVRNNPRYIFFLHWNWQVPQSIWTQHECVCFHMTDVPYGRGGSPLQNLILAGHKNTKLTALRMVQEMDAGPVYSKRELLLAGTAQEIYIRAGELSADIIRWIIEVQPEPVPQQGDVLLFHRRKPDQSRLPDRAELDQLYDFIRMLDADGYPHAFIEYGDFRLEFRAVRHENGQLAANVTIKKPILETEV